MSLSTAVLIPWYTGFALIGVERVAALRYDLQTCVCSSLSDQRVLRQF